ncbi:MAG: glycosyltransferase family 2 protein [Candidatus Kerfeldbacteria bacterium]|nr:glycosyltransferase family 2 protein [Candidatus Kerfeldbacteria bacterium]
MNPRVVVLITNFNGKHLLEECLRSVFAQSYDAYDVVVVENASSDGSAEYIATHFPQAHLVRCEKNYGFSGGNNRGMEYIRSHLFCDFVLLLNNDTRVDGHWIEELVRCAERHEDAALIGSKVMLMDTDQQLHSTGIVLYSDLTTTNRGMYTKDEGQYDVEEEIFGPIGCSVLVRMSALPADEELFEECYFAYREDDELSWRMRVYGYVNYYCPTSIIWHKHSATNRPFSRFKLFYTERNRIFNSLLYLPFWYLPLSLLATLNRYMRHKKNTKIVNALSAQQMTTSEVLWILCTAYFGVLPYGLYMLKRRRQIWKRAKISSFAILDILKKYGTREI